MDSSEEPDRAHDPTGSLALGIRAQHDYTTYLYGALPRCVYDNVDPPGRGILDRYVQIYAFHGPDETDELYVDFVDAFRYDDLLDVDLVSLADALHVGDWKAHLLQKMQAGWYPVVFVDRGTIAGNDVEYPKELLIHSWNGREFGVTAYDDQWRFGSFQIDGDRLVAAISTFLAKANVLPGFGAFAFAGEYLRPRPNVRGDRRRPTERSVRDSIQRFVDSSPVAHEDLGHLAWWWTSSTQRIPPFTGGDDGTLSGRRVIDAVRKGLDDDHPGEAFIRMKTSRLLWEHAESMAFRVDWLHRRRLVSRVTCERAADIVTATAMIKDLSAVKFALDRGPGYGESDLDLLESAYGRFADAFARDL